MRKVKVYISSKMTGLSDFNFPAFDKKAEELERYGFEVLNPAEIGRKYGTDKSTAFYRRKNIEMLLQADILFVFGNTKGSNGVQFEKLVAQEIGLPIWVEKTMEIKQDDGSYYMEKAQAILKRLHSTILLWS